jgi:hypothetical protein
MKWKKFEHSYKELAHVGRQHYNDTNFCSVIALSVVTGMAFGKEYKAWYDRGRIKRQGTSIATALLLIRKLGYTAESVNCELFGKTLGTASKRAHSFTGTYWVYSRGHVSAIRNGIMEDWSAGLDGSRKRIMFIYKITPIVA